MKLYELIEKLQEIAEEGGETIEVCEVEVHGGDIYIRPVRKVEYFDNYDSPACVVISW